MALSPDDVDRIARLARLELRGAEHSAMLTQLNSFFSIVEKMTAVDTRNIEPLYTPLSALGNEALRMRDDVVTEPMGVAQRELNQRSAPAVKDGLYLVPKVME